MNSVIDMSKAAERREIAPLSESTALLSVIERAARDPSVDLDRMERLLQMHRQLMQDRSKVAFAAALARLQPKLPIIAERGSIKNKEGGVQSRYALWEDIVGVITPVLAMEGFAISFRISHPEKQIGVTGVLTHAEGHSEETTIVLPADTSGSKNAVQAVASSVSYGKRYTAGALLNLRTGELDDDAQTFNAPITEEQVKRLRALLAEAGVNEADFLKSWKLSKLEEIPAFNFEFMADILEARKKRIDPRGDTSGVDTKLRDKHVSAITDLCSEFGSDEEQLGPWLRQYVETHLQAFPELYITVNDKLAEDGIITKANFKKLMKIGLESVLSRR
jgi:hypothetical protein